MRRGAVALGVISAALLASGCITPAATYYYDPTMADPVFVTPPAGVVTPGYGWYPWAPYGPGWWYDGGYYYRRPVPAYPYRRPDGHGQPSPAPDAQPPAPQSSPLAPWQRPRSPGAPQWQGPRQSAPPGSPGGAQVRPRPSNPGGPPLDRIRPSNPGGPPPDRIRPSNPHGPPVGGSPG